MLKQEVVYTMKNENFNNKNIQEMKVDFLSLTAPEELKRIRTVADKVWPLTYKDILSEKQISFMMEMMYSPAVMEKELSMGYFFDLCIVNGKDAGYISFSACDEVPGRAKLHKVYLLHSFHHCGIGQQMLQHACKRCREKGFTSVCLAVNKQNLTAQKAYLRAGFTVEKALCTPIGEGFVMDDYIMAKHL